MKREEFKKLYRDARRTTVAQRIRHNGRNWTVSKLSIDRLDGDGCFDRVGQHAMTLAHAAHCRSDLKLYRSTRVLVGMAREMRESIA